MRDLYALLEALGGLRPGHTCFRSGEHGNGWVEKGALISNPRHLSVIVEAQAQVIRDRFDGAEVIVGSSECGAALAMLVAERLGRRVAFAARDSDDRFGFHRMFAPAAGGSVVLVEDLVFSGRDVRDQAAFFAASGLILMGVSAWCARARAKTGGVTFHTLMPHPFETFSADECPLCRTGVPVEWRGIRE